MFLAIMPWPMTNIGVRGDDGDYNDNYDGEEESIGGGKCDSADCDYDGLAAMA
jgi:hypothetical protein